MRDEFGRYIKGHIKTSGAFKFGHKYLGTGKTLFRKGQISPRKGVEVSEETRKKLSLSHMGHKPPKSAFTSERVRGEKNVNWKGGITPENIRIRTSQEMKGWRKVVLERDGWTCQGEGCGQRGGKLHVHHIKSFSNFPELRFDLDNGITLCIPCHKETNNYLAKARYLTNV